MNKVYAALHGTLVRRLHVRSFFIGLVVLLLTVFALFQKGERVVNANIKKVAILTSNTTPTGFNYVNFASVAGLNLVGNAVRSGNRLDVTPSAFGQVGSAWHATKQNVENGFETTFQFQISDRGGIGGDFGGDGFAFVIQNQSLSALGDGGGGLGYSGISNSVAIEFDTLQNGGEPDSNHVDVHTLGTLPNCSHGGCSIGRTSAIPFLADGAVHTVKISYGSASMSIFIDNLAVPVLTVPLNLASILNLDNGQAWLGFTAATGYAWQKHEILNWSFDPEQPGSCVAPPSGMVAWWRAEGNANDAVGSNHGALVNGAGFASGMVGQAFNLNVSTQYVEVPHATSLNPTNALTIEGWIRADALPQTPTPIILKDHPYALYLRPDGGVQFQTNSSGWNVISSPPNSFPLGVFVHVAGTFSSANSQGCIYINASQTCGWMPGPLGLNGGPVWFGRDPVNSWYFSGLIDELSIYDRALSAAEIQSIYNAGSAGKCTTGCGGPVPHGNAYNDTALVEAYPGPLETATPRTPVILIHGIHGNRHDGVDSIDQLYPHYFHNLILSLNESGASYNDHYKTYKFHYVSDRYTTQEIAQALRDRIDEMCEFGNKELIIVAHSMGGIVARHYLLQTTNRGTYSGQAAGERVRKLLTLATLHHGTYGANGLARVMDEFRPWEWANASAIFAAGDAGYWSIRNGCSNCANPFNTQLPNRGSLLWNNNFDSRFGPVILNQLPWEIANDLPDTTFYNNKITAYWGEISPSWRLLNVQPHDLVAMIAHGGEGVGDDIGLAAAAYLIQAADEGSLSVVPAPENDGLVPIESARFDGANGVSRVHCAGFNHRNMKEGDGMDLQNSELLGKCDDGGLAWTLFDSIRNRIIGVSIASPSLMVGPERAGFGSHTYNVARAGSAPVSTIDVQLSNIGDAALQINSLTLAGANADQFVIVNPPTLPLAIGAESSVHITVGFNPTSPGEKTAELRAENSSSNSVVIVNISATGVPEECDLNFSPASQFMPTSGGNGEVMVGNISCPWTVSAVDDWIHPTALADRVSFTVDANAAADVRYGTMIVSVYGRPYLYSISQDAKNVPCWLQMSSDQSVVQREAGNGSFYITAPNTCGWSFQSDSPWLVPSIETLNGSGSVGFTVADNFGLDRSGIITIQGAATTAQFTVHQRGASISGTVTYGNAAAPPKYVSNVTVAGAGSPNVSAFTDAPGATAGQYQLTGFGSGAYTVSLSKTTGQNGINSFDAARVAQHVTGISLLTNDNQRVSADVSGNGGISSQDAAKIAQVAAGLPLSLPNFTNTWRFFVSPGPTFPVGASPTSRTYASVTSNLTGEDYVGLLIGDVTGNWAPSSLRPAPGPAKSAAVSLPDIQASDKEIVVPVNVQGVANKGVFSYEFDLRYDPTVIQPQINAADVKGTVSRGLSVVTNPYQPGLLKVVVYGAMPIDENGVLLNLRFTAVGRAGAASPLSFERLMFNEGDPGVPATGGRVELF